MTEEDKKNRYKTNRTENMYIYLCTVASPLTVSTKYTFIPDENISKDTKRPTLQYNYTNAKGMAARDARKCNTTDSVSYKTNIIKSRNETKKNRASK